MLYFCYKGRFAKVHKRAIRHALTLKTTLPYEETMKLDAELHANDADVPPSLRMKSLDSLLFEQPTQIIKRMHIKFQYLQSLCVLHRKYFSQARTNPHFAYSRATCTNAALQLLNYQVKLHFATQESGRFHGNRNMLTTLIQPHFLLAAMIICLDMYESHNKNLILLPEDQEAQAAKYDALRQSCEIWIARKEFSQDAERASKVVTAMLSRVQRPELTTDSTKESVLNLPGVPQHSKDKESLQISPTDVLAGPTGYPSRGSVSYQDSSLENYPVPPLDATDPLNLIFDGLENIDWDLLDQYLIEGNGTGCEDASSWQTHDSEMTSTTM